MYKIKNGFYSPTVGIGIGAWLMGSALSMFLVPFKIAPGGVSGLASAVHSLTGYKVSIVIAMINIPIFVAAFIYFDKKFLLRSLCGMAILSISAEVMSQVMLPVDDALLACVLGGALMGIGIAAVLLSGGSTGGTDIAVMLIRKFNPNLSVGTLFAVIDGIIVIVAAILLKSGETLIYSIVALMISGYVSDSIIEGLKFAKLVYIISPRISEITRSIYDGLGRGVTALESHSMFLKKQGRILLCVVRKRELPVLKRIVNAVDTEAFVIVTDAKEIMGRGFENKTELN